MDFNTLRGYNWETLKRPDLGSNYQATLEEIYVHLRRISKLFVEFEPVVSNFVPSDFEKAQIILNTLVNLRDRAQNFNISQGETVEQGIQRAGALLQEVKDSYRSLMPQIIELNSYLSEDAKKTLDIEISNYRNETSSLLNNLQGNTNDKLTQAQQKIEELNNSINIVNDLKTNVEQLNQSVQDFSLEQTTSAYGKIFKDQAKKNLIFASIFGGLFVLLITVTIFIIIHWFLPLVREFNDPTSKRALEYYIFAFIVRISVIFFVYLVIKEVLRSYKSSFHMYNLNTHRHNSLQSFEILVRNNKLPENRDDIVKQIAQTIFSVQDDGFLTSDKKDISVGDITNLIGALKK